MTSKDYDSLTVEITKVATQHGLRPTDLLDPCVDEENALVNGITRQSENYWDRMCSVCLDAACTRLIERGIDPNEAFGRVVC